MQPCPCCLLRLCGCLPLLPLHSCRARLERFNLFWQQEGVVLAANSTVEVASGALVYGGVDWVASAISADEDAGAAVCLV